MERIERQIKILYFAKLREESGRDEETVTTTANSASELYAELCQRYSFSLDASVTQVAINEKFSTMKSSLSDGDKIVFIPPVAGG